MNFKLSRIKDKQAVIEEIDYLPQRKLNKSLTQLSHIDSNKFMN